MKKTAEIINKANEMGIALPAFNVPYLPMIKPVVQAVADQDSFALIGTSRIEWLKFEAKGPAEVMEEYSRWEDPDHIRMHVDHVPVIDEDNLRVDYVAEITRTLSLGYQSVMVDGSRLPLEENIHATRAIVDLAHGAGIACEAELGAVLGHEEGPLPLYEELFRTGKGFTRPEEAARFVQETGCDWLSVAIGNIHGAISAATRDQKKLEARLNIPHLEKLRAAAGIPLVLHGGSGVRREDVLQATRRGISKVNIGTEIRQAYERTLKETSSVERAREAVFERTVSIIRDYFNISGIHDRIVA